MQALVFCTREIPGFVSVWRRSEFEGPPYFTSAQPFFCVGEGGDVITASHRVTEYIVPIFEISARGPSPDRNRTRIIHDLYDRMVALIGSTVIDIPPEQRGEARFILRLIVRTDLTHVEGRSFCHIGLAMIRTDPSFRGAAGMIDETSVIRGLLPSAITDDTMVAIASLLNWHWVEDEVEENAGPIPETGPNRSRFDLINEGLMNETSV